MSVMISFTRGNQTARSERIGVRARPPGNHVPSSPMSYPSSTEQRMALRVTST